MFRSCRHLASLCIVASLCGASCQRELRGRPAPDEDIYFPMGIAVNPTNQNIVYVMSTDWNQKYNTGWLSTVDLTSVVTNGATDLGEPDVQIERVNVPALGGELTMSPDGSYMLATFRENNTVGVFDIDTANDYAATCGDPTNKSGLNANDRRTDCDGAHLYYFTQEGVDHEFLQDEFRSPFGVRFLPMLNANAPVDPNVPPDPTTDPTAPNPATQTIVVGFLQQYKLECFISFVDVDRTNPTEILGNQRSIDLRQAVAALTVQAAGHVAVDPDNSQGRFVAVGARININGTTSGTIFGINFDAYNFNAQVTDQDATDDATNLAKIDRVDIRSQAGGFNLADLKFSKDGTRAFGAISYAQPAAGSSDSVVMIDTSLQTQQLILPNAQSLVVQRPIYQVLDTLPIQGTPQNVLYMERAGKPGLLVTATFNDNALHFVRVGPTSLDAITRLDRQTGAGPVMLAEAHFDPTGAGVVHDYVLVTAFLNHVLAIFDVTDDNPGNWPQYELASNLKQGDRFH